MKKEEIHNLVLRLDVEEPYVKMTLYHEDDFGDKLEDEEEKVFRYKYKGDDSMKELVKDCLILMTDLRQADRDGKKALYIPKTAAELRHYIKNRSLIINNLYIHDKNRNELLKQYKDAELPDKSVLTEEGFHISMEEKDTEDDEDDEKADDIEKDRQNDAHELSNQIQHVKQRKKEMHHSHHHHDHETSEYEKQF